MVKNATLLSEKSDTSSNPQLKEKIYSWLATSSYVDKKAYIAINFNSKILPFLKNLSKNFTKYSIGQVAKLKSIHAWRLLELFEQMRFSKAIQKNTDGSTRKTKKI